jgi:hypothetical protein
MNRDSAVRIETDYGLDSIGSAVGWGGDSSEPLSERLWGPLRPVMVTRNFFY